MKITKEEFRSLLGKNNLPSRDLNELHAALIVRQGELERMLKDLSATRLKGH